MREPKRKPDAERLAYEAKQWDEGKWTPKDWVDAPEAVPRAAAAQLVSIRLPKALLAILREFAEREGVGYQVLVKQWLDDRVRQERDRMNQTISLKNVKITRVAASFRPPEANSTHKREA